MSDFERLYLIFGSFIILSGVTMVLTYSLTNPWWRNHVGRMLITYAAAEILMSALLMSAVVWHVNPEWFRAAWFTLQVIVSATFCFQTVLIVKLYRQRRAQRKDRT